MDGNGRWAERQGRHRIEGHAHGATAVRRVTTAARKLGGIEALTLYAFSAQNWGRPEDEVENLMGLLVDYLDSERRTILDNDIRLNAIGQLDRLPVEVRARLDGLAHESRDNKHMVLTLALSYGGREEIVAAARAIAVEAAAGRLDPAAVDEALVEKHMFTRDLPPLDLLVRTSGELRLSNFLLWQAAYAEIVVTETLWPDFGKRELYAAIEEYRKRNRRFGKTAEQIASEPR
ncbi:polyprenyl diphosphate synthase [Myxococcota bacterium]|nr:polyprenyl diphosphate synthase [Myxococcota bacterium]